VATGKGLAVVPFCGCVLLVLGLEAGNIDVVRSGEEADAASKDGFRFSLFGFHCLSSSSRRSWRAGELIAGTVTFDWAVCGCGDAQFKLEPSFGFLGGFGASSGHFVNRFAGCRLGKRLGRGPGLENGRSLFGGNT
jgi:hypothetical protein